MLARGYPLALHRWSVLLLLLSLCSACGTTRVARPDTRQGVRLLHLPRTHTSEPVVLREEEFTRALGLEVQRQKAPAHPERTARELLGVPPRSGWYGYNPHRGVVALDEQPGAVQLSSGDAELTREYLRFCAARGEPGDCREVLLGSALLAGDGRYTLAMSFALEEVLPEMNEALRGMADPELIRASILWTMSLYAAMWLVPEPVFSKGVAVAVTASFICYVGVDTFWSLIQGWRRLVEAADTAHSLAALREAGATYGRVMGKNAARAFALLLTAAIGQTAASFSARMPTLPGAARASAVGATREGLRLTQVAQVQAVAVTAEGVTLALAPHAMAATAQRSLGTAAGPVNAEGPEHHIATDKWLDATHSGGPWTPRFQKIFDRAGVSLNDPVNKVRIKGHVGPHPQDYHEEVYERLNAATLECRGIPQCRDALVMELRALAKELTTEGSPLHGLVTKKAQ